jgi:4-amino-4-deoxychorismate lyase
VIARWFEKDRPIDSLPVDDRGLQYGDGLFETIAIRNGRLRLWPLHAERLRIGCERLDLEIPPDSTLRNYLEKAIGSVGGVSTGIIKLMVTRGSGPRGYRFAVGSPTRILLGLFEPTVYPEKYWIQGVRVRICAVRVAAQTALAGVKSLNRLEQVLARNEWRDDTCAEGLMLDADDNVTCGTMSNVFFVADSGLVTPPITTAGVCGVMRRHILAVLEQSDISASVEPVPIDIVQNFSEMFLCNSQIGLWPVRHCGTASLVAPGPVTRRVMEYLRESGIEECKS